MAKYQEPGGPPLPESLEEYKDLLEPYLAEKKKEDEVRWLSSVRDWAQNDLYFLLRYVLSTADIRMANGSRFFDSQFMFERCRDVQFDPMSEIWARGHGKTTTFFGEVTRLALKNTDTAILMVAHKATVVEALAKRVAREWELNPFLREIFPDIFWDVPARETAQWSVRDGWCLKRYSNRPEATLTVTSMPATRAGMHYDVIVFDDPWTEDHVRSEKVRAMVDDKYPKHLACRTWETQQRYAGTFYGPNDKWSELEKNGQPIRRIPAVIPGSSAPKGYEHLGGMPILLPVEELDKIYRDLGPRDYRIQYLLDPTGGELRSWAPRHFRRYERHPVEEAFGKNVYILCDIGGASTCGDDTAIMVWGLGADRNMYLLDGIVCRMDPTERNDWIISRHARWSSVAGARVIEVRIEETGTSNEAHHLRAMCDRRGYRFDVVAVTPAGSKAPSKSLRIKERLDPMVKEGRVWLPRNGRVMSKNNRGGQMDVADHLLNECFLKFPRPLEDHSLDATSQLFEPPRESDDRLKRVPPLRWPAIEAVKMPQRPGADFDIGMVAIYG